MKKPLVVYHEKCFDGLAAAWCFWRLHGDNFEYIPDYYNSNKFDSIDFSDRDVYLVDFGYPRDKILKILEVCNYLVIIDHHPTNMDEGIGIDNPKLNMSYCSTKNSGCVLAWEYTQTKWRVEDFQRMPYMLSIIQDRDMWKFELPETREVMTAFGSYNFELGNDLNAIMCKSRRDIQQSLFAAGKILQRQFDSFKDSIIQSCARLTKVFDGQEVYLVNCNGMFASEIGNQLCENRPYAVLYYDTGYARKFSVRSRNEEAIVIAKTYGGGGHPNAAGFMVPRDHPLAHI